MITSEIIAKFELLVDDSSELSTFEELALANKVYQKVCDDRPWEFLKKEKTGTINGTSILLPDDFSHVLNNYQATGNNDSIDTNQRPAVVFVANNPYLIVNWSDRKKQYNQNFCYIDMALNQIVFNTSVSGTYSFDYKYVPEDLTLTTSPVFPARFHDIIAHGMAVEDMICQLFDKARSYAPENTATYNEIKTRMAYWNINLNMN